MTERTEQTFADYMRGGGIVGWVIVLLGAVALALGALRLGALALAGRGQALADKVNAKVAEGDLAGAIEAAKGKLPVLRIQRAVLASPSRDREVLHDIAAEALLRETPAIERYNAVILVVAAVAPLLGLLGTVTGMISTFEIITEFGTGDPKMLSSGISEALITTQLGLVVAIPGVLIGNAVKGRADAVLGGFEQAVLRLVNLLQDGPDGESDDREDSEERPIGPRVVNG